MYDRDLRVWYRDLLFAQLLPGCADGPQTSQQRAGDADKPVTLFSRSPHAMEAADELQHLPIGLTADRPGETVEV